MYFYSTWVRIFRQHIPAMFRCGKIYLNLTCIPVVIALGALGRFLRKRELHNRDSTSARPSAAGHSLRRASWRTLCCSINSTLARKAPGSGRAAKEVLRAVGRVGVKPTKVLSGLPMGPCKPAEVPSGLRAGIVLVHGPWLEKPKSLTQPQCGSRGSDAPHRDAG
jgi:hypothetical protein